MPESFIERASRLLDGQRVEVVDWNGWFALRNERGEYAVFYTTDDRLVLTERGEPNA